MTDTADRVCGSCGGKLVWGNVTGEWYHYSTGITACPVHPDDRDATSLDDVYVALIAAQKALADLAVLAGRHLSTKQAQVAENLLGRLCGLRAAVMPEPDDEGPF